MEYTRTLTYKGYTTTVQYSEEDGVFFGKLEGISDLIYFESVKAEEINGSFHDAVDEYLEFCVCKNIEPNV